MKSFFIAFGAIVLTLGLTFSGSLEHFFSPSLKDHSRLNHYIDYVVSQYKESKSDLSGPIDFINSDKTHGLVGLDPWGIPYEFFIEKNSSNRITITLWSRGEDSKTRLSSVDVGRQKNLSEKGDDFIYSKRIKI